MIRTLLKIAALVALVAALAWYGVIEKVVSKGKTAVGRSNEAHGVSEADTP